MGYEIKPIEKPLSGERAIWDAWLRFQLLSGADVVVKDRHTAMISGVRVWIENYPYAFGHPYGNRELECEPRPSRGTAKMLMDRVRPSIERDEASVLKAFASKLREVSQ